VAGLGEVDAVLWLVAVKMAVVMMINFENILSYYSLERDTREPLTEC
jgi:hypothetical protein